MKTLFFCLLAVLLMTTANVSRACEYCRMAAEDPEAARLALAAHASSGVFPLQGTINQFKGETPSAVLTAPPAVGSVATSAADLPARAHRLPPPASKVPAPVPAPVAVVHPVSHSAVWANAGLVGVCGFLGFFGWRTRRTASPAPTGSVP